MTHCAGRIGVVRWGLPVLVVLATMLLSASIARAAPGDLDASFGTGGKQTLNFGGADRATPVVVTPDGRIVVVGSTTATGGGDFAVARLTHVTIVDPAVRTRGQVLVDAIGLDGGRGQVRTVNLPRPRNR